LRCGSEIDVTRDRNMLSVCVQRGAVATRGDLPVWYWLPHIVVAVVVVVINKS